MPMPFPQYANIKDNYCCSYLGNAPEYVLALNLLKPQIEEQLPGLRFWISCCSSFKYLIENKDVVFSGDFKKEQFAYVREVRNDSNYHSIIKLIEESDLHIHPIKVNKKTTKGTCLICPEGISPTKPMTNINYFKEKALKEGYHPMVLGSDIHYSLNLDLRPKGEEKIKHISEASWIIGVENEYTLLGATKGIRTTLVKTGIGHTLFKRLVPDIELV